MSLYSIAAYGSMIGDAKRFAAYRDALERDIEPGCTVLDLGTGTGVHALLACKLGARRVYAIETSDAIQVARDIARDNGLSDRIVFFHETSTRVSLPEPVDLMVSDLRGILPLFGRHLPSIVDARRRLLRGGGTMIPRRDEIWVAPVEAGDLYRELVDPWESDRAGLDMSAARELVTQSLHSKRIVTDQLIGAPQSWAMLDYATLESPDAHGRLEFNIDRSGEVHGFAVWFDATLVDGVGLSNAPGQDDLVYGMNFLPLTQPVVVTPSDRVSLDLRATLVGDDYVWQWDTEVRGTERPASVRFAQSSFHGMLLSTRSLALAADHEPTLSQDGRIDVAALGMIDGHTALTRIAARLLERFPDEFADRREALDRVAMLARRYAE